MDNEKLIKYNSLVTDLYAYYGENKELDKLIDDITYETLMLINEIKPLLTSKRVCPKCKSELTPSYHKGYYDEFPYWRCECYGRDEFFTQNTHKGG